MIIDQPSLDGFCPVVDAVKKLACDSGGDERGAVFTKPEVVEFMLDLAGYTADKPLHNMRLLEPSFGGGESPRVLRRPVGLSQNAVAV